MPDLTNHTKSDAALESRCRLWRDQVVVLRVQNAIDMAEYAIDTLSTVQDEPTRDVRRELVDAIDELECSQEECRAAIACCE